MGEHDEDTKREHKRDVVRHDSSNSLVIHIDKCNHLPEWQAAIEIKTESEKRMRRATEAALITKREDTNHREGFVRWTAARFALGSGRRSKWDRQVEE